ncbi:MAG: WYL domain-containing protein [Bacteroidales bacterium]|nr:WYL domain-containing protein [Bacteroidales bacterium]
MDTPKISKLLRLMKLLTGNVSRTIDSLAKELGITPRTVYRYIDTIREAGFVVNKLYGNVYAMGKVSRGLSDFNKLIYFTEEEAYITAKLIEGIDNNNVLKRDLQRKLASVYDSTSIGNYVGNVSAAAVVEALAEGIKKKKQCVLKGYASAHSNDVRDRLVEPIEFTAIMIDIWAYDVENGDCRVFKVARVAEVEVLPDDWAFAGEHKVMRPDVFRMTGNLSERIVLSLNTRAKSLLLEEFPLAEKDLKREDNKWALRTTIHSLEGAGRFVIGLAADIKIIEGNALKKYILGYNKRYIQKLLRSL